MDTVGDGVRVGRGVVDSRGDDGETVGVGDAVTGSAVPVTRGTATMRVVTMMYAASCSVHLTPWHLVIRAAGNKYAFCRENQRLI